MYRSCRAKSKRATPVRHPSTECLEGNDGCGKAFKMAFPHNKFGTGQRIDRVIQGSRKRFKIANARVGFHPGRRIVTPLHAMRWLAAMGRHREQERVDAVAGQSGLCQVNPVIDIGVPHLLGQRVR